MQVWVRWGCLGIILMDQLEPSRVEGTDSEEVPSPSQGSGSKLDSPLPPGGGGAAGRAVNSISLLQPNA